MRVPPLIVMRSSSRGLISFSTNSFPSYASLNHLYVGYGYPSARHLKRNGGGNQVMDHSQNTDTGRSQWSLIRTWLQHYCWCSSWWDRRPPAGAPLWIGGPGVYTADQTPSPRNPTSGRWDSQSAAPTCAPRRWSAPVRVRSLSAVPTVSQCTNSYNDDATRTHYSHHKLKLITSERMHTHL